MSPVIGVFYATVVTAYKYPGYFKDKSVTFLKLCSIRTDLYNTLLPDMLLNSMKSSKKILVQLYQKKPWLY